MTAGFLHWGLMIFATLYALGKFPRLTLGVSQWNQCYAFQFLYMFIGGVGSIARRYSRENLYMFQIGIDFLVGLSVFWALFSGVRFVLVRGWVTPWISLLPGLFLLHYGRKLRRDRQIWSGLNLV